MSLTNKSTENPILPIFFFNHEIFNGEKEDSSPDAAWAFYSSLLKRDSNNLRLHTHRVFFAMRHKNASYLSGALQDIFLVLNDAGEALRIRLLKAARPFLDEQEIVYFTQWIKSNVKTQLEYRWALGSVLSKGLLGEDKDLFVVTKEETSRETFTPLQEAQSCIEYGQLDIAQTILEDALNNKDIEDRSALQNELDQLTSHIKKNNLERESTV